MKANWRSFGFTMLELMITLFIVGILTATALFTYIKHNDDAQFTELIHITGPYQLAVSYCYEVTQNLTLCNAGANGIPPAIATPVNSVASVTVINGVITATAVANNGLVGGETYSLTPTPTASGTLSWTPNRTVPQGS